MNSGETEWVTVAECAQRLGVSVRTAQRYAAKLNDTDKKPVASVSQGVASSVVGVTSGVAPPVVVENEAQAATIKGQAALLAELRASLASEREDKARLREMLQAEQANTKAEQENTRAALAELSRAREQSAVLIAAIGAGRLQLEPAQETSQAQTVSDNENTGQSGSASEAAQRGKWWQIWRRMQ